MINSMLSHSQIADNRLCKRDCGFSLLELAIVLTIVGFLMAGLLPTLSSQVETQRIRDTRKQLDEIKDALIGYATANGRLPCPASSTSNGNESFCTSASGSCGAEIISPTPTPNPGHGHCKNPYDGFVPAASLGLAPVDSQGYMLDGWNNRIRYAVTTANSYAFTKTSGMQTMTIPLLAPDLYVCASSPNPGSPSQSAANCGTATALTISAPAVIYSTGINGGYGGGGTDELANANPYSNPTGSPNSYDDKVFVSHEQTPTFDDIVVWLSPNILISRMIAAGQLP